MDQIIEAFSNPVVQASVGFFSFVGGLGFLVYAVFNILRATGGTWQTVEGFIAQKYIKEETRTYTDDDGRTHERTVRFPHLVFSYVVGNDAYDSSNIVMGSLTRISRMTYNRYTKGDKVTVYYDPADPKVAHLEKPSTVLLAVGAALGGLIAIFGMVLIALALQSSL